MQSVLPETGRQGPPAVAILCNAMADPYSGSLLQGAAHHLNRHGCHALILCGSFPHAPLYRGDHGEPAVPPVAGALIVLSSTLRSADAELEQLVQTNKLVSVGVTLSGATNVAANDEAGVFQAMAHLVKRHDCKRIAFIAGPGESVDGGRRFDAYRFALEQLGLPYDPTLVTSGDYEAQSGWEAVRLLRQYGDHHLDSLIAANDLMAIGAIEGLLAAGMAVPQAVKVFGFDDLEEAAFVSPGLSTVRQPMAEQGAAAAELAIRLLRGEAVDATRTLIPAPLVVRGSCGCADGENDSETLRRTLGVEGAALVHEALRGMIRARMAAQRGRRELSRLTEALLRAQDYPELAAALSPIVRLLKPARFLLCTYTSDQRRARVTLESSGNGVVFHSRPESFPLAQLLPGALLRGSSPTRWCVEPLQVANEHFGYLVLEGELAEGTAPIELRQALCAALARIAMTRELLRLYSADRKRAGTAHATSTGDSMTPARTDSGPPTSDRGLEQNR